MVQRAPSNACRLIVLYAMVLVTRSGAEIRNNAIRSTDKRAHERSNRCYLRMLECNHAELIEVAGTIGPSMIAAFALTLVSSVYTIGARMRAAR